MGTVVFQNANANAKHIVYGVKVSRGIMIL